MANVNEEKKIADPAAPVRANQNGTNVFEGKVVSSTATSLVMTGKNGKESSHTLAPGAKVTRDGAACKAEDLKAGNSIRVTTTQDDRSVATCIESLDKRTSFAPPYST